MGQCNKICIFLGSLSGSERSKGVLQGIWTCLKVSFSYFLLFFFFRISSELPSTMSYLTVESKVFTKIFEGKTEEVIRDLDAGVIAIDCRYFASSNDTPLFWAAVLGNVELATYLISKGANVNFQQARYLQTPLHVAARRGECARRECGRRSLVVDVRVECLLFIFFL